MRLARAVLILVIFGAMASQGVARDISRGVSERQRQSVKKVDVNGEVRKTFESIARKFRALKSKYPQLADIERAVITESQFTYQHGDVQCYSLATPCIFGKDASRVTINISRIKWSENANVYMADALVYAAPDGTYLAVNFRALAEQTSQGIAFMRAADRLIREELKKLRRRLPLRQVPSKSVS